MVKTGMQALKQNKGFTLIEMLIVIAIIGVLASIAIPSYKNYMYTSRRAEGKTDLLKIQLGMEKWRANNNTYPSALSDAGFTDNSSYYNYAISGNTSSAYLLTATAQSSQTGDSGCTSLTLDQSGTKTPASGCW